MLTKQKSRNELKLKYLFLLPVVFIMTLISSCTDGLNMETKEEVEIVKISEKSTAELPFSQIDQAPIFPGCDENLSNEELKKCFSESIAKHINTHFNIDIAKSLNLTGKQRIYAMFKIDNEGNVTDISSRASHQLLQEETKRTIRLLPKMKPGEANEQPVNVLYSLPIIFQIN